MFRSPGPAGLPHITTLLDDIPAPLHQVARHLGITESTLKKYLRQGGAPRAIMLALFWETRWGRSIIHADAHNAATLANSRLRNMREMQTRLLVIIWRLEQEREKLQPIAANSPFYAVR